MNLPALYEPRGVVPQRVAESGSGYRPEEDHITVGYLLALLRRRSAVLFLTMAVVMGLALVWTTALPRIYQSSADVVLITRPTDVVPQDAAASDPARPRSEEVETQIQVISSRQMTGQVLDATGLMKDPVFRADIVSPRSAIDNVLSSVGIERARTPDATPIDPAALRLKAIIFLTQHLDVDRLGNSFTLRITISDLDAGRSALLANTYARLFTTDDLRERARNNTTAAKVLNARVDELSRQADAANRDVQAYRVSKGLLSSSATSLTEQEISTYNQQVAVARAESAEDAAALASARAQLRRGGADGVGEATGSQVVSALRAQRVQLVLKERDLSERYFDGNPDLVTVRQQIADVDRQIGAEVQRSLHALEAKANASSDRLSSLLASRADTRDRLSRDNTALVKLADLDNRAQAVQSLYKSYLEHRNEVVAGSGAEQPTARLISAAAVPILPSSPNVLLNLALGLVVGVLLGALVAILAELSYRGVTTLDDLEQRIGVRGLGFVPDCNSVEPRGDNPLDSIVEHPEGPFAEALRNVIVSIRHAGIGPGTVIAITSAVPGEGKSTVAACMGRALAMAHDRVVVVDCDVIRAQLSKIFGLEGTEPGMREAVMADDGNVTWYEDADSSLRVVPITTPFARGERLTERGRLKQVIDHLREEFDVVILDCPPVLPIAEAREIVSLADCGILVVHWRRTADRVVRAALRQLPLRRLKNFGAVLNGVDMRKQARFGGSDAASFYRHYMGYYQ